MKKILKFIGKYKIFLVLSVLLATVSVILQLYVPILFGDAIDQIVAEHQVQFDTMWVLLREILVLVAISALATWIMNMINNHMTYHIVQDIRSQAIHHIQRLPLSYLDRHSSGDIVSRIIADTDILSDGILLGFTQLFSWNCNDCCNFNFYVFQEFLDHTSGHCADTNEFLNCQIYFVQII